MLSRVAESIFWMARYMERTSRMLRMIHTKYLSSQDEVSNFSWLPVLQTYSEEDEARKIAIERNTPQVLEHLIIDKGNVHSVINNISRARENARSVQDHLSKEVWLCLNEYYHIIREPEIVYQITQGDPVTSLDILIRHGILYNGTVDITMAREEGFNFLNIGRFLSRSIITIDLLTIKLKEYQYDLDQHADDPTWRFLLYSLSGYEHYLKKNRGKLDAGLVIQHIIYNTEFPHSLIYSTNRLARYFERLKTESNPESYQHVEFLIGKCCNNIRYSNAYNDSQVLKNFLEQTRNELIEIATSFNRHYFGNT